MASDYPGSGNAAMNVVWGLREMGKNRQKVNSGKSSLVNALLGGRKMLKEGIEPMTRVPAEILYWDKEEYAVLYKIDGTEQKLPAKKYRLANPDPALIRFARLYLCNNFLNQIPNLVIADLPGFDGDIQDSLLEKYLPGSIAFLVLLPADNLAGALTDSFAGLLDILCQYEADFCFVITKCDKVDEESIGFRDARQYLQDWLRGHIREKKLFFYYASVMDQDKLENIKEFLRYIQEKSDQMLWKQNLRFVQSCMEQTEKDLKQLLERYEMKEIGRRKEKEEAEQRMEVLERQAADLYSEFLEKVSLCIKHTLTGICQAVKSKEEMLVTIAGNNQNPEMQIIDTVSRVWLESIRNQFMPDVRRYLRYAGRLIQKQLAGGHRVQLSLDEKKAEQELGLIIEEIRNYLDVPRAGQLAFSLFPTWDTQQEERKENYRRELCERIYPQLKETAGRYVEAFFRQQAEQIDALVKEEIQRQKESCQKAFTDSRQKEGEGVSADEVSRILDALEAIEGWKNELQGR